MSSIIEAIHDDMDEYVRLCQKYGELPSHMQDAYGHMLLDCYGEHAKQLEDRQKKEWGAEDKKHTH